MLPKPYVPRAPEVSAIWVIVPFWRPEHLPRVIGNFERQTFQGKRLILVANGPTRQRIDLHRIPTYVTTLASSEHQSAAKNEAIAYIKSKGGGFFTSMDDDDWYGPEYLSELAGLAKQADVIGKLGHFVSVGEGVITEPPLLLCTGVRYAGAPSKWVTGGTLSGFAEDALEFQPVKAAEEVDYAARALARGMTIRASSVYHYLYRRHYLDARHAWAISKPEYLRMQYNAHALECAEYDLRIVTGERPIQHYRMFGRGEFRTASPHLRLVSDSGA